MSTRTSLSKLASAITGAPPNRIPPFVIAFHPRRLPIEVRTKSLRVFLAEYAMTPMRVFPNGGVAQHEDGHLVGFDLRILPVSLPGEKIV